MIGRMAGRVQNLDLPAITVEDIAMGGGDIRAKVHIGAFLERVDLSVVERSGSPVRAFGDNGSARLCLQTCGEWRVVLVRVRDEDVADGPAPGDTHALTLHAGQSVSTPWAGGCLQVQPATRGAGLRPGGYQLVAAAAVRGQRIQPAGRPAKTLKAVFQENAVPVWLRDHWPVLTLNDDLVALPGLTIGADFSVTADKDGSNDDAALMVSWQADSGSHGLWNL